MPQSTQGIPEGSSPIIPRLICENPDVAVDFYVSALGATEIGRRPGPDGRAVHALLMLNGGMIMVDAPWSGVPTRPPGADGSSSVVVFAYVDDVDATVTRAVSQGARIVIQPTNQFWGDRTAYIIDPLGHVWTLASRVEETTEDQREERWSQIVSEQAGTSE